LLKAAQLYALSAGSMPSLLVPPLPAPPLLMLLLVLVLSGAAAAAPVQLMRLRTPRPHEGRTRAACGCKSRGSCTRALLVPSLPRQRTRVASGL
jgi:hypothetical protein